MKKIKTVTLGCRFNFYETEISKAIVGSIGHEDDVVIINTCSVTHEAARKSRQAIRKAIRENPESKIIVTGCAIKTDLKEIQSMNGIHKIIQNEDKLNANSYKFLSKNDFIPDIRELYDIDVSSVFDGRSRIFLQIQTGCDNFCSYCIVPYTRGRSTSLSLEKIISHIKYFVNLGFKEIILSGIDITSYGKDIDEKLELADVLETIVHQVVELKRIRISSLDPAGISEKLLDVICGEEKILPHFHLSVQSGDNSVLREMRRRHKREDVIDLCNKILLRKKDVLFGADFIAGFPTETEDMFQNTINLISEAGITFSHVFPYSPRSRTPAANMLQLPKNVIEERAKRLASVADGKKKSVLESFVGKKVRVFVECSKNDQSIGKTDNFIHTISDGNFEPATIIDGLVTVVKNDFLIVSPEI